MAVAITIEYAMQDTTCEDVENLLTDFGFCAVATPGPIIQDYFTYWNSFTVQLMDNEIKHALVFDPVVDKYKLQYSLPDSWLITDHWLITYN